MSLAAPLESTSPPNPTTFLTGPSPSTCTPALIDFSKTSLPEYKDCFAMLIQDLLTATECTELLHLAQQTTTPEPNHWAPAEVNIGGGRQMMILDARNCGRIIWDDATIAERLLDRIKPHLPARIVNLEGRDGAMVSGRQRVRRRMELEGTATAADAAEKGETWAMTRLNERLRFLKYTRGMYFKEHCDGSYRTPDGSEVSYLTVHIYLNGDGVDRTAPISSSEEKGGWSSWWKTRGDRKADSEKPEKGGDSDGDSDGDKDPEKEPLVGGATRFFSVNNLSKFLDVNPKTGSCLVFQHRHLLHSGEEVDAGVKYTMRTDVMYRKVED